MRRQRLAAIDWKQTSPRRLLAVLAACCVLFSIGCQMQRPMQQPPSQMLQAGPNGMMPPGAFAGTGPDAAAMYAAQGMPMPYGPGCPPAPYAGPPVPVQCGASPWTPPGLPQPWPRDEYLIDGGDRGQQAKVLPNWEVQGLELEDTVVHYDTVDGRVLVEPSNRVCIYSPRFASVRQVVDLRADESWTTSVGAVRNEHIALDSQSTLVGRQMQRTRPETARRQELANQFAVEQSVGVAAQRLIPHMFENAYDAYENFTAIRTGVMREAETARLAERTEAAQQWTHNDGVEIMLDKTTVAVEVNTQTAVTVYSVTDPPGEPKLRIIKVASKQEAQPGEIVEFTLRYDNVGTEVVGNVTLIDNLTTRLEYIPDSAQASVDADFLFEPNDGGSLALRWEIIEPVAPGEGGVIRFNCRVR